MLILHIFFISSQGVPGEAGAAGATGPRVSWLSVINLTVWLTDCQTCRWLLPCPRSGRAWFPRRERSCRHSGSAGTSRSAWNSWNWRTQGESSIRSTTRRRWIFKLENFTAWGALTPLANDSVVRPPVYSYHIQQQQQLINVSMSLNNNSFRCLWGVLCWIHSVFSQELLHIRQ